MACDQPSTGDLGVLTTLALHHPHSSLAPQLVVSRGLTMLRTPAWRNASWQQAWARRSQVAISRGFRRSSGVCRVWFRFSASPRVQTELMAATGDTRAVYLGPRRREWFESCGSPGKIELAQTQASVIGPRLDLSADRRLAFMVLPMNIQDTDWPGWQALYEGFSLGFSVRYFM